MAEVFFSKEENWPARPVAQFAILLLALTIYLWIWFLMSSADEAYLQLDSRDYRLLGQSIFTHFDFPSSFRTPVFPVFQGFWETFLGLSVKQYVLVQIALAVLNIFLLGRLVRVFAGSVWQSLTMLAMSLDLVTIQVANYVLSETLFSFLLLVSLNVLVAIHYSQKNRYGLALVCGLLLGLFALCRPVGQFIPLVLVAWLMVCRRDEHSRRSRWIVSALIVVSSMSLVHAWKLFNYIDKGTYATSVTTSINMYNYRAAWNVAYRDGRPFDDVKEEFHDERDLFKRDNPQLTDFDVAEHFMQQGLAIILATPKETFFQAVRGFVFLYGGIYNGSLERIFKNKIALNSAKVYSFAYNIVLYLGVLFSLFYWKHLNVQQRSLFTLSALVVFYFTFFSVGVESYARLRAPLMPYMVIISILGWLCFIQFGPLQKKGIKPVKS